MTASTYLHEHGADFDSVLSDISAQAAETQKEIDAVRRKMSKADSICRCFRIIEQYRPIAKEYEAVLLKERFREEHQNELDLYSAAMDELQIDKININADQYSQNVQELKEQMEDLVFTYEELQSQIDAVNRARKVIEQVRTDELIITEGKRGKNYGR